MRRNRTIHRFASLRLIKHEAFSAIERIPTEPVPLKSYCVPNAKASPTHQFGQNSYPRASHLDAVTLLEARVAVAIGGVDYRRILLGIEIAGRLLNDLDSSQPKRRILNQPSGTDAKIEKANQSSLFLAAGERCIFPCVAKLSECIEIHLNKKTVSLVGAPRDKLLFKDDLQFVEGRLGEVAGFGIGQVGGYGCDKGNPRISLLLGETRQFLKTRRIVCDASGSFPFSFNLFGSVPVAFRRAPANEPVEAQRSFYMDGTLAAPVGAIPTRAFRNALGGVATI